MAKVNLSEAARLVGVDRSTIHRWRRTGKLTVGKDRQGKPHVDTAELERVAGELRPPPPPTPTPEQTAADVAILRAQLDAVQRERDRALHDLDAVRADHQRLMDVIERQTKLLEDQRQRPAPAPRPADAGRAPRRSARPYQAAPPPTLADVFTAWLRPRR